MLIWSKAWSTSAEFSLWLLQRHCADIVSIQGSSGSTAYVVHLYVLVRASVLSLLVRHRMWRVSSARPAMCQWQKNSVPSCSCEQVVYGLMHACPHSE